MFNDSAVTRRAMLVTVLRGIVGTVPAAGVFFPGRATAQRTTPVMTVYKDPACQCCTKWVAHMREHGFALVVKDRTDMESLKDSMSVPASLRSCHTAGIGKFVIEGHVPSTDVAKLLKAPPLGVVGLAAPGMPSGAPGMETGGKADAYAVMAFTAAGAVSVFGRHGA